MFTKACRRIDLTEGGLEVAAVRRTLVLIVWPIGGTPRAYQGFCPHVRQPLAGAAFDGKTLVCPHHEWVFETGNGKCINGKACNLARYPLKIEGDDVMVDVAGVEANYL